MLTTGHAIGAPEAIDRVAGLFPLAQPYLAQIRLAATLVAGLGQMLVPRASGKGRIAAVEIMRGSPAVKKLVREGKVHQLHNVMRTSSRQGMMTMDQSLDRLYVEEHYHRVDAADLCPELRRGGRDSRRPANACGCPLV